MTDSNHSGDQVNQYGDGNIGIIKFHGQADPQAALQEVIGAITALRGNVGISSADRRVIDESAEIIRASRDTERGTLRKALGNVAGIATLAGEVGVPVIEAVRKMTAALGL